MFEVIFLFILIWSLFSILLMMVSKIPSLKRLPESNFQQEKVVKKSFSYFLNKIKSTKRKAKTFLPSLTKESFHKIKDLKNIKFTGWHNKKENETNLSDDYWEKIKKG